ncbi:MAG: response regulator transcription factor [Flavobacteriales bacterium]
MHPLTSKTELNEFIQSLENGLFSAIYTFSASVVMIYDMNVHRYLYMSPNCKNILPPPVFESLAYHNEHMTNLVCEPYKSTVDSLLQTTVDEPENIDKYRFSINLPIGEKEQQHIFLMRYSYLSQANNTLLIFASDITKETSFSKIIFTVEKEKSSGNYELISKKSVIPTWKTQILSKRENEIQQLLNEGLKSREISAKLGISMHTVSTIRKNIKKKLKS